MLLLNSLATVSACALQIAASRACIRGWPLKFPAISDTLQTRFCAADAHFFLRRPSCRSSEVLAGWSAPGFAFPPPRCRNLFGTSTRRGLLALAALRSGSCAGLSWSGSCSGPAVSFSLPLILTGVVFGLAAGRPRRTAMAEGVVARRVSWTCGSKMWMSSNYKMIMT